MYEIVVNNRLGQQFDTLEKAITYMEGLTPDQLGREVKLRKVEPIEFMVVTTINVEVVEN